MQLSRVLRVPVLILLLTSPGAIQAFHGPLTSSSRRVLYPALAPTPRRSPLSRLDANKSPGISASDNNTRVWRSDPLSRKDFVCTVLATVGTSVAIRPVYAATSTESLEELRGLLQQAKQQMEVIPGYIAKEQWDSVRAVLITPPLSDLWTKSARKTNMLQDYANGVGDNPAGDELAVLEAKEELEGRLRFLDMAVYNNVFNPIKTEGKTGASPALIRSSEEDPKNEYKGSIAALDELIRLGQL
jgi:hypothetical protein